MGSFFRNQTFPQNFYRRPSPADIGVIGWTSHRIMIAHPLRPGANAPNGTYVPDIVPRSVRHAMSFISEALLIKMNGVVRSCLL